MIKSGKMVKKNMMDQVNTNNQNNLFINGMLNENNFGLMRDEF